jgi:hypothetical protein
MKLKINNRTWSAALVGSLAALVITFSASQAGADTLALANGSFEKTATGGGWDKDGGLSAAAEFGWKNNLGKYALAGKGANHFTAAADGEQAIHLRPDSYISQSAGPTAADQVYRLTFSLLQSKHTPSAGAALKAEIFDGAHRLAARIFRVPKASNTWQSFTLQAVSPHSPTGLLTLQFTGITAGSNNVGPWLDNVTLTAASPAPAEGMGKAANERITVASYYFGNYHPNDPRNEKEKGKGWSEWELVKAAKPRFPGHQQPHTPLWGYRDESEPAVMAQKIDAAANHGVDAFIFDWYHYDDGPFLDRPIDEGFLKATNNHRLKFAFMWANHDWQKTLFPYTKGAPRTVLYPGKVSPAGFEKICDHLIKDYFQHPSYWKIDGQPYFSFYDLTRLLESFGTLEATRTGLDKFRAKARAAGLPGLHLNAVVWGRAILPVEKTPADSAKLVRDLGFDSVTSYVWIHHVLLPQQQTDYDEVRDGYFKYWDKAETMFEVPFFPNVTMGWDPSPRCDQNDTFDNSGYPFTNTIGNNTPGRFRAALELTKQRLLANPDGPRILNINCWNEWTEGSYLEPDMVNGLQYLEAVREVFGASPKTK